AHSGPHRPDLSRLGRTVRFNLLPLTANPGKAKRAELELVAQPPQDAASIARRAQGAGQVVRSLSLLLIADQAVRRLGTLKPAQRLGINARPEQCVIADVAMTLAAPPVIIGRFGLGHHPGDMNDRPALLVADPPDHLAGNETGKQVGHITDQRGITDPQLGHECRFGQSAKEPVKWMRLGNHACPIHPGRSSPETTILVDQADTRRASKTDSRGCELRCLESPRQILRQMGKPVNNCSCRVLSWSVEPSLGGPGSQPGGTLGGRPGEALSPASELAAKPVLATASPVAIA